MNIRAIYICSVRNTLPSDSNKYIKDRIRSVRENNPNKNKMNNVHAFEWIVQLFSFLAVIFSHFLALSRIFSCDFKFQTINVETNLKKKGSRCILFNTNAYWPWIIDSVKRIFSYLRRWWLVDRERKSFRWEVQKSFLSFSQYIDVYLLADWKCILKWETLKVN